MSVTRRAHAKINLCLSVGPAEPAGTLLGEKDVSGFHPIATWMSAIELWDDVRVTRKADGELTTFDTRWADDAPRPTPIDWNLSVDLAQRAHGALEKKLNRLLPADIEVTKRIPVGGGLGGGSSDAAATLLALNDAFELGLSEDELFEVGMSLGSDVGFFIEERDAESPPTPALVSGFGEAIERVEQVEGELILIVPSFGCATKDVYGAFDGVLAERVAEKKAELTIKQGSAAAERYEPQSARDDLVQRRIDKAVRAGSVEDVGLFNDLYIPATRVEPRLGKLASALGNMTRHDVHLTGSGSCLFILTNEKRAEQLLGKVRLSLASLAQSADSAGEASAPAIALRTRLM